jgi:hypothetical protein
VEDLLRSGKAHDHGQKLGLQRVAGAAATWRVDEEVEEHGRVGSATRQQKATATQAGERGFGNGRGEARTHGRIEGVAPGAQQGDSRVGHSNVTARDRRACQSTTS